MNKPILSQTLSAETAPEQTALAPQGNLFSQRGDRWLWTCMLVLLGIGIVMVYSASTDYALRNPKIANPYFFLYRHLLWMLGGFVAFFMAAHVDYRFYKRWAYPILGIALVLLFAVLVLGPSVNHARRWFRVGGLSFQPSEFAKMALVIYLAATLAHKGEQVRSLQTGFLPPMLVCGTIMVLLLKQPDLGTALILWLVTLTLLFVSGTKVVYIFTTVLAAAPVVYMRAVVGESWRLKRLKAFFDPWKYQRDQGMQSALSLTAVGSGGFFGKGLGQGRIKLSLPEAHTDYILAVIGEELGFVGMALVISLYASLVVYGGWVARRAKDAFGTYLAIGISALLGYQAAVNAAVILGLIPTKGLTLPLISYGGSSLVIQMFALGVLLNISRGGPSNAFNTTWDQLRSWLLPPAYNRALPGGGKKIRVEV